MGAPSLLGVVQTHDRVLEIEHCLDADGALGTVCSAVNTYAKYHYGANLMAKRKMPTLKLKSRIKAWLRLIGT